MGKPRNWNSLLEKRLKCISSLTKLWKSAPSLRNHRKFRLNSVRTKKDFSTDWESLRKKTVVGKIMEKNKTMWIRFPRVRVTWNKIPWISFRLEKKPMDTNWIDLKSIELNSIDGKFVKLCSIEVGSMETAFVNGETRTKTTSLTGMPGGPLSNKCIARNMVSLKESPWNLIWLMKSP